MKMTTLSEKRRSLLALGVMALAGSAACEAQVSLATAVDLALSHSPKVRVAQADVAKAQAGLAEAKDIYIPVVNAGAALGQSYGYSFNPPTLFTFSAQSLAFNFSQRNYIQSANFGLNAARLTLADAREGVEEDTALTFLAVQHDQQREAVLGQQLDLANRLVQIVEDRVNAGRDTAIDLTQAQLNGARLRLARLQAEDDMARDSNHLALALGLDPDHRLVADGELPAIEIAAAPSATALVYGKPAVAAAYAQADAKERLAIGDSHYILRPQFSFVAQYNRYATFTNSFAKLKADNNSIGADEGAFAIQISLPLFDRGHQAKARESAADAAHARAEADDAQRTALDGESKLRHSLEVLRARADVARLDRQLAEQQLEALTAQLNTGSGSAVGPQLSPKDEQNSKIAEREKYLSLIDAEYQLRQSEIQLLRQTGQLEAWLKQASPVANRPTP